MLPKNKIKDVIFCYFTYIIQNQPNSLLLHVITTIIQTIQIISFSFDKIFQKYWKRDNITQKLNHYLSYFRLLPFFSGDFVLYSIGYISTLVFIISYIGISTYYSINLYYNRGKLKSKRILSLLANTFTLISHTTLIPSINVLASIFNIKDNGKLYYVETFSKNDSVYYVYLTLGVVFGLIFLYLVYLGYYLCYDQIYNKNNINSKQTSIPDLVFFFEIIIIVFVRDIAVREKAFVIIYFLFSICTLYLYWSLSSLYNTKASKTNICFSLIIFWNSLCLAISALLQNIDFTGGVFIFLCGVPILLLTILFFYEDNFKISDLKKSQASSANGYIHIVKVMELIDDVRQNERKSRILLDSYIVEYEKQCPIINCPLSQYWREINQGNYNVGSLLLQHIEVRFKKLIRQFPSDAFIRIMFAYFIDTKLNKQNLARSMLINMKPKAKSLAEKFFLFRVEMLLEKNENQSIFENEEISYSNLFDSFKDKILFISKLYSSFWSTLFFYHQNSNQDLTQLDDIGHQIEKTKKEIDEDFLELQRLKPSNIKVLKYYSDFLSEVLNDHDNASKIKGKIKEIKQEYKNDFEKHLMEVNLKSLTSDEFQFLVASTNQQDFGFILEVSLGICTDSGYTKQELIGNNINILIPEIFRAPHNLLLRKHVFEFNQKEIDDKFNNGINHRKEFPSFSSFLLSKPKFLVPVTISPYILTNESFNHLFLVRIERPDTNNVAMKNEKSSCYLLTNLNYIIQNYSVEALKLLAIEKNDEIHKKDLYLGNFIKDFKSKLLDKKQNNILSKEVQITWSKKSKLFNVNLDFICSITIAKIKEYSVGYIIKLTLNKVPKSKFNINNGLVELKDGYIPSITKDDIFLYNFNKNSFGLSVNDSSATLLTEQLRIKAYEKLKKIEKDESYSSDSEDESRNLNSNTSSEGETERDEFSDNSESKTDSNAKEIQNTITPTEVNKGDDEHKQNLQLSGYYVVNTTNIKFFIYNFQTNSPIENNEKYYFNSQIQIRVKEMHDPILTKKSSLKAKKFNDSNDNSQEYHKIKKEQNDKIIKQIQYSLDKNEARLSILDLRSISFLIFLILIGEGVFLFFYISTIYERLEEYCTLIQYSFQMLLNCVYSIFYTRELTLLSFPNYTITFQNDQKYLQETFDFIKNLYEEQQHMTDHIVTTSVPLSEKANQKIYGKTYTIYMIKDDYNILGFNISLTAALSQTLGTQFVLSTMSIDSIIPTHQLVYFNFLNSLNGLYTGLLDFADIFEEELIDMFDKSKKFYIFCLIIYSLLGLIFYFVINKLFFIVFLKKNDYLAVFYEISLDVIRISLEHCETFNQKMMLINEDTESSISTPLSDCETDDDINEFSNKIIIKAEKSVNSEHHHTKKKLLNQSNKGVIIIKIFLFVSMMISSIFTLIIILNCSSSFSYLQTNIAIFKANSQMNTRFLMLFNLLREYMFDKDIYVKYLHLTEYLPSELTEIIEKTINDVNTINKNLPKGTKTFSNLFQKIYYEDICDYSDEFFNSVITNRTLTCEYITYNSSTYGLFILQQYFLEEIKELKSLFDNNMKNTDALGFQYNFTLYGTKLYSKLYESLTEEELKKYNELNPFRFFISEKHDHLVIVFREIYLPLMNVLNESLIGNNQNRQKQMKTFNKIVLIAYFCGICIGYCIIWRKIEFNLLVTIKKAKNMLMLLPKEILVELESIMKLFNINANVNNNVNDEETECK